MGGPDQFHWCNIQSGNVASLPMGTQGIILSPVAQTKTWPVRPGTGDGVLSENPVADAETLELRLDEAITPFAAGDPKMTMAGPGELASR